MNLEEVKELIRVFGRSKLNKLEIKDGKFEIAMSKESSASMPTVTPQVAHSVPTNNAVSIESAPVALIDESKKEKKKGEFIRSPMVGTFYAAPSPDASPFIKVGDSVNKGQVLCILEAMKIMNELEAEFNCKILEILVEDGQPVEYDMPLFRVERI